MSSSVIGSAHAPAWLEPVEDPPRRAARTARLARRAVAGDAGTHIDRVQQASSDRRHSTRRHGRRGNAGVPPRAPVTQSLYKGRLRCPRPTHQGALAFHLLIGMFKPLNRVEPGTYQGLSCHAWFIVGPSNNFQVPKYSRLPRLRLRLPLQVQVRVSFSTFREIPS
jgi:hypothetical protein